MRLLIRLSSILLFVATIVVMLAVMPPDVTAQDPTPTLTPTAAPLPACQLYHTTVAQANVRTCAGTDCSAAGSVTDDDTLCVIGVATDADGWLMVKLEPEDPTSEVSYISAEIVAPGPPGYIPPVDMTCEPWEVAVSEAIVRQCAGEGCAVLGGLPQSARMCVLEYGGEYQDWLYVDYSSVSSTLKGWMSVDVARRLPAGTAVEAPQTDAEVPDQTDTTAQLAPPTITPQPALPVCPPGLPVLDASGELPAYAAEYPYVVSYTVRSGDMLFGLAQQFDSTVDVIREANELGSAGTIIVGQSLLIPVKEPQAGYETLALEAQATGSAACITPTPTPLLAAEPLRSSGGPFIAQDVALSAFGVGNIELGSPRATALFSISVPSNWLLDGNNVLYLNVDYQESVPERDVELSYLVSLLDVYLDDELISSVTLSESNIGTQTLVIPLPSNLLTVPDVAAYTLQLVFEAEDHCLLDAVARMFIRSDLSYFHFEYHTYYPRLDLARYPEPFYTGTFGDERESVYLVLPDEPAKEDYEAGAGIAAALGQLTFNDIEARVLKAAEVTDEIRQQNNLLLIGEIGKHSLIDELYAANALQTTLQNGALTLNGETLDENDGIVQLISNPSNDMKAVGVVTGLNAEALRKAAQALSGPPSILGLGGPLALVAETRDIGQAPPGARLETTVTFRDLGVEQLLLTGVGNQIAEVRFFAPTGAQLAPDAKLDLMFTYSGALGRGSNISVLMNDTPLASAFLHPDDSGFSALEKDELGRNHLVANIPTESVVAGATNRLILYLDAREQIECVFPDPLVTWFNVSPDSELFLPRQYADPTLLTPQVGWFPVPFNGLPNLQDMLVSLPAEPTSQDVEQAYQLLSRVGSETTGGMAFRPVVAVGELPDGLDLAQYNLLVVGRPTTNPLLEELNVSLPQSFVAGTDAIDQALDDISYRLPPGYDIGVLQALQSPWASERSILVATGTGPVGQGLAVGAISQDFYGRRGLAGDVVFVSASDVSVVDTRDLYFVDYVVEELEVLQTSAAVDMTATQNVVYTVTPGPTPTGTATATPSPVLTATPIFPTATQPTPLPSFTPLPEGVDAVAQAQQPAWVNTLLLITGVVLLTTLIFGLLLLARSRRNGR
ncbi:MAG: cellulose biosynthesis cyclic di-GMP-binding regulatory protein BcsB [Anaerolineae bacterium]|nr:cellulose biosynthesis cyclic di-GMP-binding regulatory protein BcsB [Anaerolineae bacterium]